MSHCPQTSIRQLYRPSPVYPAHYFPPKSITSRGTSMISQKPSSSRPFFSNEIGSHLLSKYFPPPISSRLSTNDSDSELDMLLTYATVEKELNGRRKKRPVCIYQHPPSRPGNPMAKLFDAENACLETKKEDKSRQGNGEEEGSTMCSIRV